MQKYQWSTCWFCGCDLLMNKKDHPRQRTVDHVTPSSAGGERMVDACKQCNNLKGQSHIEDYREWRGGGLFFGEIQGWEPW